MTYQNLWDTAKAVLRGKLIAMSTYIKRTKRSQRNELMLHLKLQEKQVQAKPKTSRRREIIKIRAKINEIETKKAIEIINKTKTWFFEKICKIDKPLANLTKMRVDGENNPNQENQKQKRIGNKKHQKKSKESSETTLRNYIPINLKLLKKWTNF
jgi:hypothetical protein